MKARASHRLLRDVLCIGRNDLQDHAMLDLAASRVLEFGIGNVLDLDFSWLGVDDAAIFAHDKPLLQWSGELSGAKASGRTGTRYSARIAEMAVWFLSNESLRRCSNAPSPWRSEFTHARRKRGSRC